MSKQMNEQMNEEIIEEKKIKKNHSGLKSFFWGCLAVLCMTIIAGLAASLFTDLMVKNQSGETYFLNPFTVQQEDMRHSEVYAQMLESDIDSLMDFMAVSSLLTTNGEFDTAKTVDVIAYVNRKGITTSTALSEVSLEYRVGDLIQWVQEGFYRHYEDRVNEEGEQLSEEWLEERYYPTDGGSIRGRELPPGVDQYDLWNVIEEAANDLNINYQRYSSWKAKYQKGADMSLKYVMCKSDGSILASNLEINGKLTQDQIDALENSYSYLCYTYINDKLTWTGITNPGFTEIEIKNLFHRYSYLFKNKGTIYIAVDPDTGDTYHTLYQKYNTCGGDAQTKAIAMGVLAVMFLLSMVLYTKVQPVNEKDKLPLTDRGFSEIVAGVDVVLGISMVGIIITILDEMHVVWGRQWGPTWTVTFPWIIMGMIFVLVSFFVFCFGSLVRRIKAHVLWKNSLTRLVLSWMKKGWHMLTDAVKGLYHTVRNHPSLIVRNLLPYVGFIILNIGLVLIGGAAGLCIAALFDIVIGYMIVTDAKSKDEILEGISKICEGNLEYQIDTVPLRGENRIIAEAVNQIGSAVKDAVEKSRKDERLKAELITNVSHDIKTPLTSIINYVDLLKQEDIKSEKAQEYICVLDQKSQRLKQLTLDLVEASKISSGNIQIEYTPLNLLELMNQALGEYEDKLKDKNLEVIFHKPEEVDGLVIRADARHTWRVLDNLLGNVCKYAMEHTRVYVDVETQDKEALITIKNISNTPLNIPVEELFQRFTRGDESRSTEGSGLGLSIAQSLVTAQGGQMDLTLDGDLFKVEIRMPSI